MDRLQIAFDEHEARTQEDRFARFKAGWKYAEQENAALAGMAAQPEVPADCGDEDSDFFAGYEAWLEQPAC